jgi:hypothetical protein
MEAKKISCHITSNMTDMKINCLHVCHISENSHFHSHCHDNLKPRKIKSNFYRVFLQLDFIHHNNLMHINTYHLGSMTCVNMDTPQEVWKI